MKRLLVLLSCCVLWALPARAQTCTGTLPFGQSDTRLRADAAFTTDVHLYTAGLSRGFDNDLFATGGIVLQNFSGGGGTNLGFFGTGGREMTIGSGKKYAACPMVTIGRVSFDGGSNTFLDFGGSVGFEVPTSGKTKVIPTVGVSVSHERISEGEPVATFSETFLAIHAGVGLVFNEQMSLVPQLFLPVGSDTVDSTFAVDFILKLGGKKP